MTRRGREIETLLVTMFAAAPLYLTGAVGRIPLLVFHLVMLGICIRVAAGKGPELVPGRVMRVLAIAFVPFYLIDAAVLSRSAIAASTHLVLFIAAYQPIESLRNENQSQRMLTTSLIFIASLATSTHITITLFVIAFAFLMFRQMIYVSHLTTVRLISRPYSQAPASRAAGFYLAGAIGIGALLFPLLPRVRNPIVRGMTGALPGATTALSETINFSEPRVNVNDAAVVARIWMSRQASAFFTPLRLRGAVYDRFQRGEWRQTQIGRTDTPTRGNVQLLAKEGGITQTAVVQQRPLNGRLFIPVGTYAISGLPNLWEGPRGSYGIYQGRSEVVNFEVRMATAPEPIRMTRVPSPGYPVTPEVRAFARQVVAGETRVDRMAARIESHLSTRFRYVADPASLGRAMSVEDFLLRVRAGHCEYFAAGMVVMLNAVDVPARIVGGFYGGRRNPLTGYVSIRREDAHAWVEAWDGQRWVTYDPSPPALRPGNTSESGLGLYAAALSDSINYFWDRYVLTYGLVDQITLAADLITWARDSVGSLRRQVADGVRMVGSPTYLTMLALVIALGLGAIAAARRGRPLADVLAEHLATLGIEVTPATTMGEAIRMLREQHPESAAEIEPLVRLYQEEQFSAHRERGRAARIRKRLAELRT